MILSKEIEVQITSRNSKYWGKMGYKFNKIGDSIFIPIDRLSRNSHFIINISCDYCNKELKVPYKRYNLSIKVVSKYSCSDKNCSNNKIKDVCNIKYGVDNPFQADFVKEKSKETLKEKYGVEHQMHLQKTKDKIKATCLDRYGVDSYNKTEECLVKIKSTNILKYGVDHHNRTINGQEMRKITRLSKGLQIPDDLLPEYRKYRLNVNRVTGRIKNELLNNWDGYDYYDGEYIKDYFNLSPNNRNYPHFDHKISVKYGFYNKISPEIIGSIENVCITKQWINGLKKYKCEVDFIKEFKTK